MGNKFYNFVWTVLKPVYGLVYPHQVKGLENIPAEGGFVLCINHISAHDPLLVCSCLPRRRRMFFLSKKELSENPILRPIMRWIGGIPVDRGNADLSAVRNSLKVLKDGYGLGIFPQGTRSRDNTPTPMLNGASMIALRGSVPVVPAYIDGPYKPFRRMKVSFGAPLDLSEFGRRCDSATLSEVTKRIETGIWGMRE